MLSGERSRYAAAELRERLQRELSAKQLAN